MEFRTVPPDPAEFPRLKLLWPPAALALLFFFAWAVDLSGHQWNIHGEGALLLAAIFFLLLVGAFVSAFSLIVFVPALRRYPTLRTRGNLGCTAISLVFFVVAAAYLIFGIAKVAFA